MTTDAITYPPTVQPYVKPKGPRVALNRMGSKRRIGREIIEKIRTDHPDRDILIVPFAGGLGGSTEALQAGMTVFASDLDPYVIALISALTDPEAEGYAEMQEIIIEPLWVTRHEFLEVAKHNPENYPEWYVGYLQCVWSFGGDQRSYLFGKNVEMQKMALHLLVVHDEAEGVLELFGEEFGGAIVEAVRAKGDIKARRLAARSPFPSPRDADKYQLQHLISPENVADVQSLIRQRRLAANAVARGRGGRIDLQQLEQLGHLEQLEQLETVRLNLSCGDYKETARLLDHLPLDRVVVYCDPPYEGTKKYASEMDGGFDHSEHWQWAESLPVPVYVSEYGAPEGWVPTFQKAVPVKQTSDGNHRKATESLYVRGTPDLSSDG